MYPLEKILVGLPSELYRKINFYIVQGLLKDRLEFPTNYLPYYMYPFGYRAMTSRIMWMINQDYFNEFRITHIHYKYDGYIYAHVWAEIFRPSPLQYMVEEAPYIEDENESEDERFLRTWRLN